MSKKILLVEDEAPIVDSVAYSLRSDGFNVEVAYDGLAGISSFRAFSPDLIILDLMLPKLNGLDFCRAVRKGSNVPIIMLTARTDEIDRVVGLELGADDYVPKPFSVRELAARVKAVLRRTETRPSDENRLTFECGALALDLARRRATVNGEPVHLPLKQFELLRVLMANKDRVLGREELFMKVWGKETEYDTRTLDVHMRWLRERVEADPGSPRYIRTIRGVGYRLVCGVED